MSVTTVPIVKNAVQHQPTDKVHVPRSVTRPVQPILTKRNHKVMQGTYLPPYLPYLTHCSVFLTFVICVPTCIRIPTYVHVFETQCAREERIQNDDWLSRECDDLPQPDPFIWYIRYYKNKELNQIQWKI